jgi:hypothetical protein
MCSAASRFAYQSVGTRSRIGRAEARLAGLWPTNPAPPTEAPVVSLFVSNAAKPTRTGPNGFPATSGFSRSPSGADSPARLLAMQKVEGSNPFSRFTGSGSTEPQNGVLTPPFTTVPLSEATHIYFREAHTP